jgi:AraC-like DNA-binding protein
MNRPHNQERIVIIHQMLFEMARGNFTSRIPLSSYDDELETLVVLINMVAEEMHESIFREGYVNAHSTHQLSIQTTFLLSADFIIQSYTSEVSCFLGYSEQELVDQHVSILITPGSLEQLYKILDGSVPLPAIIALDFTTDEQLLISVSCGIGKLVNRPGFILSLLTPIGKDLCNPMVSEIENSKQIKTRKTDALLIQKLYDYILAHLDEPLPSLKELSRLFGTNEHKLKDGFRHFFKTSIYQFYNEERLKRAHYMIEHTALPLKSISIMNGFNNYPNFSKSFKKHYGFSPYEVQRTEGSITLLLEDYNY